MAPDLIVPQAVLDESINSMGRFFERLNGIDSELLGRDHVSPTRYIKNIDELNAVVSLSGKRVLEVGSGFGISLALMLQSFGADAYGIEPGSEGFSSSFQAARKILEANGLDPARVVDAVGEHIPFPDSHFDVVYSNNVIEHTNDPAAVLKESVRVLKPGGTLFFEAPNFLSYYEGHYLILQPPILHPAILPMWVRWIYRRDPAFARTLRTEINPGWFRRNLKKISEDYPVKLQTTGEGRFLNRLGSHFEFQTNAVEQSAGRAVKMLYFLNWRNWIGRLLVSMQAHYPLVVVAVKD